MQFQRCATWLDAVGCSLCLKKTPLAIYYGCLFITNHESVMPKWNVASAILFEWIPVSPSWVWPNCFSVSFDWLKIVLSIPLFYAFYRIVGKFNVIYEFKTFASFVWSLLGTCFALVVFLAQLVEYSKIYAQFLNFIYMIFFIVLRQLQCGFDDIASVPCLLVICSNFHLLWTRQNGHSWI